LQKKFRQTKGTNRSKFELYPGVKPRKSIFSTFGYDQVFNPGFINSPDCFTFIGGEKFPFYIRGK
jgi:hypothetical protein